MDLRHKFCGVCGFEDGSQPRPPNEQDHRLLLRAIAQMESCARSSEGVLVLIDEDAFVHALAALYAQERRVSDHLKEARKATPPA